MFDVGETKGGLWVAMELLEGEGLDERLARDRPEPRRALELARGILAPLGYLHERGLVHRDLKPSNVFLTPHGVKLLDFGLALSLSGSVEARLTQTGAVVGTPGYMAPEQWRGKEVGPPADLFACGAILYEMLAGRPAFPGGSAIEVFRAVALEDPAPIGGGPELASAEGVVRRALAKASADRFPTAAALSAALAEAMEALRERAP